MNSLDHDVLIVTLIFEMTFAHIIAEFYLQGILAKMKQKQWWIDTVGVDSYYDKHVLDCKIALLAHSFIWSFMIHILFLILYTPNFKILLSIFINTIIHCIIDDLKTNASKISLFQEQVIHLEQIVVTVGILSIYKAFPI